MLTLVNFTNIHYNKPIYIDNTSYIKLNYIPQNLIDYANVNYDKMVNLIKTPNKSNVMVFNKNYSNPQLVEEICERYYKSYLNTPKYPTNSNKSFMFSGKNLNEIQSNLPDIFKPYYNYIKNLNTNYNQIVVNYYETEKDYIPYHRDWTYNMIPNYEISILTLNQKNQKNRIFNIQSIDNNKKYNIELFNGLIITMGGQFQSNYRHAILKLSNNNFINKRLGITFRQFI